jgi:hypothetical protein
MRAARARTPKREAVRDERNGLVDTLMNDSAGFMFRIMDHLSKSKDLVKATIPISLGNNIFH